MDVTLWTLELNINAIQDMFEKEVAVEFVRPQELGIDLQQHAKVISQIKFILRKIVVTCSCQM